MTEAELRRIMPRLSPERAAEWWPLLSGAMREFGIRGRLREAAFVAQLAHESGQLRHWQELASGQAYEGRTDLGNTEPGDGPRYKGRGPIQLTGRANYRKYGRLLELPLEEQPDLAARPEHGFRIAGLFWKLHGCNELADRQDFRSITRRINGGLNGLRDREAYYRRALSVLRDEKPVTVIVRGTPLPVSGWLRDGAAWLPLRAVMDALGGKITSLAPGQAGVVRDGRRCLVALWVDGGTGYAPAAELAAGLGCRKQWDGKTRTVTLEGEA